MSLTDNPQSSYAEEALRKYGYRPEFRRELKRFASFAVGFSFISITTGIFTTYGYVLIHSGPLGIWTWPLVIVGQLFVALVFGALASRMPVAGGFFPWGAGLGDSQSGGVVGWVFFFFFFLGGGVGGFFVCSAVVPPLFSFTLNAPKAWR